MHDLALLLTLLAALALAPQEARPCAKCDGAGHVPCGEHSRRELQLEEGVLYCSVLAECAVCGGTARAACPRCGEDGGGAELAERREEAERIAASLEDLVEAVGRPLPRAASTHFAVAWGAGARKAERRKRDEHELAHLALERLERAAEAYRELVGAEELALEGRPRVLVAADEEEARAASKELCGYEDAPFAYRRGGDDATHVVQGDERAFEDDAVLHRHLVHHAAHALASVEPPARWLGGLRAGWADAGIAAWVEDRLFGDVRESCTDQPGTASPWQGGAWRAGLRRLVAAGDAPPLETALAKDTVATSVPERALGLAVVEYVRSRGELPALLARLRAREPAGDAIQATFGEKLDEFEAGWREWVLATYPRR